MLKRITGMDIVEGILKSDLNQDGLQFSKNTAKRLGITGEIKNLNGPFKSTVFISTHHTGGLDFISTFPALAEKAPDLKVVLNEKILKVEPLKTVAIPVHPLSSEKSNQRAVVKMMEHLRQGGNLLIYPAGKIANKKNGIIEDHEWQAGLGKVILKAAEQVVPLYVNAENSETFYRIRNVFPTLSMLLLLRTVTRSRNVHIKAYAGKPINNADLKNIPADQLMKELKRKTYELKKDI